MRRASCSAPEASPQNPGSSLLISSSSELRQLERRPFCSDVAQNPIDSPPGAVFFKGSPGCFLQWSMSVHTLATDASSEGEKYRRYPTVAKAALEAKSQCLSVVVPCFNEEQVIPETLSRLRTLCDELQPLSVELIFVDDGSRDHTRQLLKAAAAQDPRIRIIAFARNFGHQIAVTAGIDAASGDAVVLIDADLQDPPEVVHQMVAKWREGFDVVYGRRAERIGESAFKLATARGFYRLLNRLSDVPIPLDTGDFRLMSRNVVETLRAMPERDRFVRGMVSWVGFRQTALSYKRAERFAGVSKYPLRKMIRFATDGILSFSTAPLQMSAALGVFCALLSMLGIVYAICVRLFTDQWVEGWAALFIAILFVGGVQLLSVGILGEYVGRIYNEIKNRPLYVVQEYCGFEQRGPAMSRSPVVAQP
jgi:polyisoprenyl-phosphate glycosyltransferase